mgnify:CR=1 FL=1
MNSELKNIENLLVKIEKHLSRLNAGIVPIAEKLQTETTKKKKQIRAFESSKYFEELKGWSRSFGPSSSGDYMTATDVQKFLSGYGSDYPLAVVGAFLNHYFKGQAINKAIKGGSSMYKVYNIREL